MTTTTFRLDGVACLTSQDAADYVGLREASLRKQRLRGSGIPFSKVGATVLYDLKHLDIYNDERKAR